MFAGRRICFPCTPPRDEADLPLQKLGDCCRRLLGSHGVIVQVSVSTSPLANNCDTVVKCLVPHLCGMEVMRREPFGFSLQQLLPAAAQLERACIYTTPDDISMLGQFHMLKELHVNVLHFVQLTVPCHSSTHWV